MRYTIVRGLDDAIYFRIEENVFVICEVTERGHVVDSLVSELELTGTELWDFLCKFHLETQHGEGILPNNRYRLIAYDW